ncbi:hypothetical protein [Spiroplasma endosymbiont of Nomada rufipes]
MNDKDINGEKIISVILNSFTSYQNITYFNYWDYSWIILVSASK